MNGKKARALLDLQVLPHFAASRLIDLTLETKSET